MFLIVFMWNLYKCKCWLISEVTLQNSQCNNKIYWIILFVWGTGPFKTPKYKFRSFCCICHGFLVFQLNQKQGILLEIW